MLHKRAIAIRESTLGLDHVDVAYSLERLGKLYLSQGDYVEAISAYERCLRIKERALGSNAVSVGLCILQLCWLYEQQGNFARSEELATRYLSVTESRSSDKESLSADNWLIAQLLHEIARLHRLQGDFEKSEVFYKRALTCAELQRTFPDFYLARVLAGLAAIYRVTNRPELSEPLEARAIEIRSKRRGQGLSTEAESLSNRMLANTERALGPDHPHLANLLDSFAQSYVDEGEYAKAEPLYRRSLSIREKALGPDHRSVATSLETLADLFRATNRPALAEPIEVRAAKIRTIKR